METKQSTGLIRTKFPRNEIFRKLFPPHDWDWEQPKRPYLELPEEALYNDVLSREKNRTVILNCTTPASILDSIAGLINARVKITINEIFKIGELLHVAKPYCQQAGIGYRDWVTKKFTFSYETSINYVHVYEQCMGVREIAIHLPMTVLYKISRPSFPDDLRDWLLAQGNLEEISCNHVDKLFKKYRSGEFKFEAIEDDINKINRSYKVFRQTHSNLRTCEKLLKSIIQLEEKLDYPNYEVDWDDPNEIEPEAVEITKMVFATFDEIINKLKVTVKESNRKLDHYHNQIKDIKSDEL
jgi:hypothetical protein